MKVLIDNTYKAKPINFTSEDLAISSLCLGEEIKLLEKFSKKCFELDEVTYNALLLNNEAEFNSTYVKISNQIIIFIDLLDWEALNLLYTLDNVSNKLEIIKEVKAFNEDRRLTMLVYKQETEELLAKMYKAKIEWQPTIPFFNIQKAVREFRKVGFKIKIRENKILLTLTNVKIGNDYEGYLIYNNIHLFIKDFTIDGFLLRFDNFDFSSYWNIPFILHPFLSVPHGFNNKLAWIPKQNYTLFAQSLYELCTNYSVNESNQIGFLSIAEIISHFQDLRILWNGNKFKITDRLKLSKAILKTKIVNEQIIK